MRSRGVWLAWLCLWGMALFGRCDASIVVPNGTIAPFHVKEGIKIFHLVAEPLEWEFVKGVKAHVWGFNGSVPGPVLEVVEGDRVRIYVTNKLPAPTTVHWHGVILPCGMDGVHGLTQPPIPPGRTAVYEFTFSHAGTFMYHSHFDPMTQEGMGLTGMIVVHKPGDEPDRDFVILLNEWKVSVGTKRPDPNEMTDFNLFTMNGKAMPSTEPLVAKLGDKVWIRFGNLSAMDHHPIHLHGYAFKIIGTDGGWARERDSLLPETTVLVPVGSARVVEFVADNPGDWLFHCHMTHHTMNQMGHGWNNLIGADLTDLVPRIREQIPGFMLMGENGMGEMAHMRHMGQVENSAPMKGFRGQFGRTVMGGMANVLRVREGLSDYRDPGPYKFPEGTTSWLATPEEMEADGLGQQQAGLFQEEVSEEETLPSLRVAG